MEKFKFIGVITIIVFVIIAVGKCNNFIEKKSQEYEDRNGVTAYKENLKNQFFEWFYSLPAPVQWLGYALFIAIIIYIIYDNYYSEFKK